MNGQLNSTERLDGHLSAYGSAIGTVSCTHDLLGSISAVQGLSGVINDMVTMNGAMTIPKIITENEEYIGTYQVTPKSAEVTVLDTKNKIMRDDVTIFKIPRWNTSNVYGTTVYIGENNGL